MFSLPRRPNRAMSGSSRRIRATRLPVEQRTAADEAGVALIDAARDRASTIAALLERTDIGNRTFTPEQIETIPDFLALGAARWWLGELTIAMGHPDGLDHDALTREALQAARAWAEGDINGARNRLRAAFEVMTQARERFYPVDAYLVDLCLLDPAGRPEELREALDTRGAFTLFCPAKAIEAIAARDPDTVAALRTAVDEGLGRRDRRRLRRGRRAPVTRRVDPLAVPQGGRRLPRAPRRPERRDGRPPPVRPLSAAPAARQAVRLPFRPAPGLRRRQVPGPRRDEAALGRRPTARRSRR